MCYDYLKLTVVNYFSIFFKILKYDSKRNYSNKKNKFEKITR